jgi:hypothetical protein
MKRSAEQALRDERATVVKHLALLEKRADRAQQIARRAATLNATLIAQAKDGWDQVAGIDKALEAIGAKVDDAT